MTRARSHVGADTRPGAAEAGKRGFDMRMLTKLVAGVVAAVTVAGWAAPAGAAPLEHLFESEVTTEFDDAFCGDLDVRIDSEFTGHILVMPRKGVPFFQANIR